MVQKVRWIKVLFMREGGEKGENFWLSDISHTHTYSLDPPFPKALYQRTRTLHSKALDILQLCVGATIIHPMSSAAEGSGLIVKIILCPPLSLGPSSLLMTPGMLVDVLITPRACARGKVIVVVVVVVHKKLPDLGI